MWLKEGFLIDMLSGLLYTWSFTVLYLKFYKGMITIG